ncbi:TPM domain-containing protein, partial [Nocardia cyriacigeorgica]|uniref:TPM domain-containing protein n=1 Tax=Nocardia cyriacigeorgica TaxID=135487 RepID=UPI0024573695
MVTTVSMLSPADPDGPGSRGAPRDPRPTAADAALVRDRFDAMALHRVGRWSLLVVLGVLVISGPAVPGSARAEAPTRMDTYVVDSADALGAAGSAEVRAAVDRLYTDHQVRLWVNYVGDFAGLSPQSWAAQTAERSGFGDRDLLLAVAVDDRAYAFDGELPGGVSESELDRILTSDVEPALRDSRWADAGVAAADGLGSAMSGGGVGLMPVLIIGALIVCAVAALVAFTRVRRRRRECAELEQARTIDPTDAAALAALPLPALHARSRELLVDIDNAVRTSSEELELATGEFGETAALPFRTAVDQATTALAQAFAIRQRLDDAIPETPDEQRALLLELIGTLGRADRELDEQVAAFDAMRDLLINAAERLDGLTRDLVELTGRAPAADEELSRLVAAHPPQVLTSIRDNVAMARERIAFAETTIDAGREALRRPVGQQGGAVAGETGPGRGGGGGGAAAAATGADVVGGRAHPGVGVDQGLVESAAQVLGGEFAVGGSGEGAIEFGVGGQRAVIGAQRIAGGRALRVVENCPCVRGRRGEFGGARGGVLGHRGGMVGELKPRRGEPRAGRGDISGGVE